VQKGLFYFFPPIEDEEYSYEILIRHYPKVEKNPREKIMDFLFDSVNVLMTHSQNLKEPTSEKHLQLKNTIVNFFLTLKNTCLTTAEGISQHNPTSEEVLEEVMELLSKCEQVKNKYNAINS
jgi:hypothetical protein